MFDGVGVSTNIGWNPELHPRGPEGKFVEKPGWGTIESIENKLIKSNRVLKPRDWSLQNKAEETLINRLEHGEKALDHVSNNYKEWFSMERGEMLNAGTSDLWATAAKKTGNFNEPKNSRFDLSKRTVQDINQQELETVFEVTRENLRDIFGDTIPVTRGIHGEFAKKLKEAKENGESVEINHRTLESWSTYPAHAKEFAEQGSGEGVLITTEIPIEKVFGASQITPGLEPHENEIIAGLDETTTYDPEDIHGVDEMKSVYKKVAP